MVDVLSLHVYIYILYSEKKIYDTKIWNVSDIQLTENELKGKIKFTETK